MPVASDDQAALAAEAFVYGFPLVFDLQEVDRFTRKGIGGVPATPFNRFGHASTLAGPQDKFVSINNDTVYSIAQVDLSAGPVRLKVPDTGGRYYVLQFVDAWTNNFAYVGHRATGTKAGSFLLLPPGEERTGGDDAPVIRFPTAVASIVGRWAVKGEDDLPAVQALQAGLTLRPLGAGAGRGLAAPDPSVPEELRFFEQLRVWMQAFPPAARDLDHQRRFAPLGLLEPASPYVDPAPGPRSRAAFSGVGRSWSRPSPTARAPSRTAGASPTTASTTTSTSLRSAPSTTPTGSSRPSPRTGICCAPAPPEAGCGATTATRPPTRWSTRTATASS
jgi:hypothetical protein